MALEHDIFWLEIPTEINILQGNFHTFQIHIEFPGPQKTPWPVCQKAHSDAVTIPLMGCMFLSLFDVFRWTPVQFTW